MAAEITENDLIEVLRRAMENPATDERPSGAMRTSELCQALGIKQHTVWDILHALKDAGKLEVVDIPIRNLANQTVKVPGYRLIKNEEEDEKEN